MESLAFHKSNHSLRVGADVKRFVTLACSWDFLVTKDFGIARFDFGRGPRARPRGHPRRCPRGQLSADPNCEASKLA